MSTNPADGEVYSIPRYVIKFVSEKRQVGVFFSDLGKYVVNVDVSSYTVTVTAGTFEP